MPTYARAPESVAAIVRSVVDQYHPDLAEARARIGAVMAFPTLDRDGEPTGPALTHHGEPALATIKINAQKDARRDFAVKDIQSWKPHAPEVSC